MDKARAPGDTWRFLRTWMEKPSIVGAVAPSGRALSRQMAAAVDPAKPGLILELGPGTGVVTEALIAHGIAPERIVSVEYDPGFCDMLRDRFPGVAVVQGDAFALDATLPPDKRGPFAAVVSSLPLGPERAAAAPRAGRGRARPHRRRRAHTYSFPIRPSRRCRPCRACSPPPPASGFSATCRPRGCGPTAA